MSRRYVCLYRMLTHLRVCGQGEGEGDVLKRGVGGRELSAVALVRFVFTRQLCVPLPLCVQAILLGVVAWSDGGTCFYSARTPVVSP
jgi:hypothetical protein